MHIDNGVLAFTLALSPIGDYEGGGTFFEHLGEGALVEMDAGHATRGAASRSWRAEFLAWRREHNFLTGDASKYSL